MCNKTPEDESIYEARDYNEFLRDLRKLQQNTKCSNRTCLDFIHLFSKYVGGKKAASLPQSFRACDKELKKQAGVNFIELHGCANCNKHVFKPDDKAQSCPLCGSDRYDSKGKPNEVYILLYYIYIHLYSERTLVLVGLTINIISKPACISKKQYG